MFSDQNDDVAAFEAILDDDLLLPTDDGYSGDAGKEKTDAAGFEDHVEEFDENGDPIETEDSGNDEGADGEESGADETADGASEEVSDGLQIPDDHLFDVDIDGETYEVNLPELTSGYLRNEDFVKRSTELETTYSQKIAAAEAKELELIQELESFAVLGLSELRQLENINWAQLKTEDPESYNQKRVEYFDKREAVQAQINRKDAITRMSQQAAQIKAQAYLKQQTELVQRLLPEFNDAGFQERLTKYAHSVGFSNEEVGSITDARQLLVLEQARKFAEGQTRKEEVLKKKPLKELPEVLKPAAAAKPINKEAQRNKAAVNRLREEGTVDAAAAAFLQFI